MCVSLCVHHCLSRVEHAAGSLQLKVENNKREQLWVWVIIVQLHTVTETETGSGSQSVSVSVSSHKCMFVHKLLDKVQMISHADFVSFFGEAATRQTASNTIQLQINKLQMKRKANTGKPKSKPLLKLQCSAFLILCWCAAFSLNVRCIFSISNSDFTLNLMA